MNDPPPCTVETWNFIASNPQHFRTLHYNIDKKTWWVTFHDGQSKRTTKDCKSVVEAATEARERLAEIQEARRKGEDRASAKSPP